jgi:S1-C subfamily serine protease
MKLLRLGIFLLLLSVPWAEERVRAEDDDALSTVITISKARCVMVSTLALHEETALFDALLESKHYCCTGVVIEKNLVLTNLHVLGQGSEIFVDGHRSKILKESEEDDLLLLYVETPYLSRVKFKETLASYEPALCVGNPGGRRASVLRGKVVKVDGKFIYSDCFVNVESAMGASGSGLYSLSGELIGLKKGMLPRENGESPLSVAIPAAKIKKFLEQHVHARRGAE